MRLKAFLISFLILFYFQYTSYSSLKYNIDGKLMAGASRVEIRIDKDIPLAGYGRRRGKYSLGIHDRVYSRAVVLDNGIERIAIVNADLLIITDDIRKAVSKRIDGIVDDFLLAATHTHSGPGGYFNNLIAEKSAMGKYRKRIFASIVDSISQAIIDATKSIKPAIIGISRDYIYGLSLNRRFKEGMIDPELTVIGIEGTDGDIIAYIINFAAHPTLLGAKNLYISGDFPGFLERYMEDIGYGVVLFLNGACGNTSPVRIGKDGFDRVSKYGEILANRVMDIDEMEFSNIVRIGYRTWEFHLPSVKLYPIFGIFSFLFNPIMDFLFFPDETTLQIIKINRIIIVAVPCDLEAKVGIDIKNRIKGSPIIVSYANDYIGYVISKEAYKRGGYETKVSFFGSNLAKMMKRSIFEALDK